MAPMSTLPGVRIVTQVKLTLKEIAYSNQRIRLQCVLSCVVCYKLATPALYVVLCSSFPSRGDGDMGSETRGVVNSNSVL